MMGKRLLLGAGVLLAGLLPTAAFGAIQGIGVSPTSQDVALASGGSYSGQITVLNDGDRDVSYKIYATDYHVSDEAYVGDFSSLAKQADASPVSWFSLPQGKFTVKSRVQTTFAYTVKAPPTATVGGHYGAVFIETIPPASQGPAIVSRVERIGTLFYLTVKGDLQRSGSIVGLSVAPLQPVAPVRATLRLRNDGNVHFLAEGSAQLSGLFGAVGKPLAIRGEVLPGTTRRFDLKLPATSPIGIYKVTTTVKYLDRTEEVSRWMLLMPRLTFLIVSGTIMLLLGVAVATLIRRAKKRRRP